MGYRLIGQILFYFALRRKQVALRPLSIKPGDQIPAVLHPYWEDVRRYDYDALFKPHPLDSLVQIPSAGQQLIRTLIEQLAAYDWASLSDDVLGSVFERLIPREEQVLLGQFYTPRSVADLLAALTIEGDRRTRFGQRPLAEKPWHLQSLSSSPHGPAKAIHRVRRRSSFAVDVRRVTLCLQAFRVHYPSWPGLPSLFHRLNNSGLCLHTGHHSLVRR
jgi:hypothetical protein